MGKLGNFLMIMSLSIVVLYAFGLVTNTFTSEILNMLFNPTNTQSANLWIRVVGFGISALAVLTTVTGIILKNDLLIIAPLIVVLLNFAADYMVVYGLIVSYTHPIVGLIFMSPFLILYVFTVVEWWRGITT